MTKLLNSNNETKGSLSISIQPKYYGAQMVEIGSIAVISTGVFYSMHDNMII